MKDRTTKSSKKKPESNSTDQPDQTRRKVMIAGAAGVGGALVGGLNASPARARKKKSGKRRVCLLLDTQTHMMPDLAKEMARRDHDLVIGQVKDGLPDELKKLGAQVEVVPGGLDITKPETFQTMVDAALKRFGQLDSACFRSGAHSNNGTIMEIKDADAQTFFEGNMMSVVYALQAFLKPMLAQGSGQIVINTSSSGLRPTPAGTMYSATRAGANMLVRNAALTAAAKGVVINATGTYALDYPSFYKDSGSSDPKVKKQWEATMPLGRFTTPREAAYFVASLIDGVGTGQTAQFFSIYNGWCFD